MVREWKFKLKTSGALQFQAMKRFSVQLWKLLAIQFKGTSLPVWDDSSLTTETLTGGITSRYVDDCYEEG